MEQLETPEGVREAKELALSLLTTLNKLEGAHASNAHNTDPAELSTKVRQLIRERRLRDRFFDGAIFSDPAWDILLDLFAADLEGRTPSVSSVCVAASVPPTTALRWIGSMVDLGILTRELDPRDLRRGLLRLSDSARLKMYEYMEIVFSNRE